VMDEDALRNFLEERCPGAKFGDGDIRALLDSGFDTEVTFAAATKENLKSALPTRFGVVGVLVKPFVKPAGMFPCQGFAVLKLMFFMDLYAMDL
jgi:hypothetical protein